MLATPCFTTKWVLHLLTRRNLTGVHRYWVICKVLSSYYIYPYTITIHLRTVWIKIETRGIDTCLDIVNYAIFNKGSNMCLTHMSIVTRLT